MPIIETKKILTFTEEEKELINAMIDLIDKIDCGDMNIPCEKCPFCVICAYGCADLVEKRINKLMDN